MFKRFSMRTLVVIVICLILSLVLISGSVYFQNKKSRIPFIQQFSNDIVGIGGAVTSLPINGLHDVGGNVGGLFNAYKENKELKKKINTVSGTEAQNQLLLHDNQQLKKQLNLTKSLKNVDTTNATVIDRSPSLWNDQIIVSKGANAGVEKGMSALVDTGLIGRVVEVNRTNSKVELITNGNDNADRFAVSAVHKGKSVNGLITGYDKKSNKLMMGNVVPKVPLQTGDQVLTSGLGGNTPKGIYVGKISKLSPDGSGLSSTAYITPAANMNDIEVVTLAKRTN